MATDAELLSWAGAPNLGCTLPIRHGQDELSPIDLHCGANLGNC